MRDVYLPYVDAERVEVPIPSHVSYIGECLYRRGGESLFCISSMPLLSLDIVSLLKFGY